MKIGNEDNSTTIGSLDDGDAFHNEDEELCIATDEFDNDERRLCVCLSSGTILRYDVEDEVERVDARVVV